MYVKTILLVWALILWLLSGCGGTDPTILASTPTPGETTSFSQILPPKEPLPIKFKNPQWMPTQIGNENNSGLINALAEKKSVMMLLGKGMHSKTWEENIFQMVKAASPNTKIVVRAKGTLDKILLERGEIPYRTTVEPGGQDMLGRPWYIPKEHPLQTDWLQKKKNLKGAEAILLVDFINVEPQKLRQMRKQHRGNCKELTSQIQANITNASSYFEPLASSLNQSLQVAFSNQLKAAIPFWKNEIKDALRSHASTSQEAGCLQAYSKFIKKYDSCINNSCSLAPSFFGTNKLVIGVDLTQSIVVPDQCPGKLGRDYVHEIEELGRQSIKEVIPAISAKWAEEIARAQELINLKIKLEDFCAPAHRRISAKNLKTAHGLVADFITRLKKQKTNGKWLQSNGQMRIPTIGAVEILAEVKASDDLCAQTIKLGEQLNAFNQCRDTKRRIVQVALIDVGSSELYYMSTMFEEQLVCENLPPETP